MNVKCVNKIKLKIEIEQTIIDLPITMMYKKQLWNCTNENAKEKRKTL